METQINFIALSCDEAISCNGGGFAYDVGCVVGFIYRFAQGPVGQAEAYAVWIMQHPK